MQEALIAHIRKENQEPQFLEDHLLSVSQLAGGFAGKIGLGEVGEVLGLLHDLGKASQEFQNYLRSAAGWKDPDVDGYIDPIAQKGKIDHSSAGAQLIHGIMETKGEEGRLAAQILALCIASHHSGLIDCISPIGENVFEKRINKPDEHTHRKEAASSAEDILKKLDQILSSSLEHRLVSKLVSIKEDNDSKETALFKFGLLIRYLFSCLIDADRLDTAIFENPREAQTRNHGLYHPWETLIDRLDVKLREFTEKPDKNEVDHLRQQVSQACLEFASRPQGIYRLTVPTGGGKTLASLRFALEHAACHQLDRVFYIIPYTSIIDQNADEIRKILEDRDSQGKILDRVVLEHHSNLTPEEESHRQSLLSENWDAPIIFTTQVQFLEALFGSGTRSARRMHSLANSVIILDEVQTVPINTIHMLNSALRFLVHSCGSTVVLCTATQPPLDDVAIPHRSLIITPEQRMIANEAGLFERLKRVDLYDGRQAGGWSDTQTAELVENLVEEQNSVLVVVNTKKSARSLFQVLRTVYPKNLLYHLSTNMCPAHRLHTLEEIKDKLARQEPVICISTQLIEAGVDIDFGSVVRYLAGLDSITQAAGRCNRHGHRKTGKVWVVNPEQENLDKLRDIKIGAAIAQRVLDEYQSEPARFNHNPIGIEAMAVYYQYYFYERREEMKYRVRKDSLAGREDDLFNLLSLNTLSVSEFERIHKAHPDIAFKQAFQTGSRMFRVIDSPTRGVIVPYNEEGKDLVNELCSTFDLAHQYRLLKKAQRYSVNLFPHEFGKLSKEQALSEVQKDSGVYYLHSQYYSNEFGWTDEAVHGLDTLII